MSNTPSQPDSQAYQQKKRALARLLTIYGRKPVLEALQTDSVRCSKLHLADSNQRDGIVKQLLELAERQAIPVAWHDRKALSRISKNGKQDQGVAADLELSSYRPLAELGRDKLTPHSRFIALDGIHNPQNLGMIIRSVAASGVQGVILPRRGCAALSPLVIKASAGTLFKAPIYHAESLVDSLRQMKALDADIVALSSHARQSLFDFQSQRPSVFVLGNETEGVSREVAALCNAELAIPMSNGVESLNVAVTAALLAFAGQFQTRSGQ